MNNIKISIRNLVEFILRSGDIVSGYVGRNRAVEGTRIHSMIQKEMDDNYTPEVTLKTDVHFDDLTVTVQGRADGIIEEDDNIIIDEIKSTTRPLEKIDEDFNPLHWAQAKCYGYIYCIQNDLAEIDIQLTYYQIDTEEIKRLIKTYKLEELTEFFNDLMDRYYIWANFTRKWMNTRDISIKELEFPFGSYRKGQRRLAVGVYRTIDENKKIFAEAPTGIGKTISTVFPSVKAIGENKGEKIFYLTAKTITRSVAQDTFKILKDTGLRFKTVTLTAKDKICFCKESSCNPEECEYAKGHFDRVNDSMYELLNNEDMITREVIEEYAKKYTVCPFEFSLDLSLWADAIICDYNYVFDPRAQLKRFFLDAEKKYLFLIDEAHNLVDRSREMFSAVLHKDILLALRRVFKEKDPRIAKALSKINSFMLKVKKECNDEGYHIQKGEPEDIYYPLKKFVKEADEWLQEHQKEEGHQELLELYFEVLAFLRVAEDYDERYVTYVETNGNNVSIKLFCLDPSYLLSKTLEQGKASIFFSATLSPLEYYKDILGGKKEDNTMSLTSPFDKDNLMLMVADRVSTKYRNREFSYESIADIVYSTVKNKKGNYMVFFPSYKYMNDVYETFIDKYPEVRTMIQEIGMSEEEREDFLYSFKENPEETLVTFAVMGGIYSEGIDLKGDRLSGAIVVGVGLPMVCLERNIIRDYFNEKNNLGYEYSYMYPGMNKVLQAAGRVIRTEKDKGVVCLIDERFSYSGYKKIFPAHLRSNVKIRRIDDMNRILDLFWKE
ncbi:ATP-dependent DNA helicase [Clostridium sp. D2Q-11]|uniref:DNA 5'-3' helicase n=1 Tax=Anaeromonas frigoriresistens TaxID=2683708 RepID=A0A942Z751_9FIRM|nr:ATP-dependent DNA helicase [Anaeromonas frigoriresistens]MBS4539181.1 ATP-dependent DNA helicase [Anaeromonas frigoriresistens]